MSRMPKTARDRVAMRDQMFPDGHQRAWPDRDSKGWCRVPRTIPVILTMLDRDKSLKGGKDVTRTYLTLLAHNWDEGLIVINDEAEFARMSGFTGTRAVRSWKERMRTLLELGFIEIKPRGEKVFGYALLIHPYLVVQKLQAQGKIKEGDLNLFHQKHLEFGASEPPREPFTVIEGGESVMHPSSSPSPAMAAQPTATQPTTTQPSSIDLDQLLGQATAK